MRRYASEAYARETAKVQLYDLLERLAALLPSLVDVSRGRKFAKDGEKGEEAKDRTKKHCKTEK